MKGSRRGGGKAGKGFILTLILLILFGGITGGVQYYLWSQHMQKVDADWSSQVAELEATIINVGSLTTVFTVVSPVEAGAEIIQTNLMPIQIPESFVGGSYVLDPADVVGKFYKVNLKPGTPLTSDLIMSEEIDDTVREIDITAMAWPIGLKAGDYVDFEITYPMGEIYTVLSHVRVNDINTSTIKTTLTGVERHLYSGALVDYFLNMRNGATISMTKYVEPGVQKEAIVYYAVPENILSIISADPNIISKVDAAVNAQRRAIIESGVASISDQIGGMISAGRMDLINQNNAASNTYWESEKERLEQEAYDAAAEAGQYVPPVVPGENLIIEEGVVD